MYLAVVAAIVVSSSLLKLVACAYNSHLTNKYHHHHHLCHSTLSTIELSDTGQPPIQQVKHLSNGRWVKFICGASNHDAPLIRNLCYLYTSVGVDCIDISADPTILSVALEGINAAMSFSNTRSNSMTKPLLMISVNDDTDLHFRKAQFDPERCPSACPRPCEKVCPAAAIPPKNRNQKEGVITEKCYGCGRCITVCPLGLIDSLSYQSESSLVCDLIRREEVDAIEIHTGPNHENAFRTLWSQIGKEALQSLKIISVSFPNMGLDTMPYLQTLQSIMIEDKAVYDKFRSSGGVHIWQADGRPMSGDIGNGTAHAATELTKYLLLDAHFNSLSSSNKQEREMVDFSKGRHFVQLAGGTNINSPTLVRNAGLLGSHGFGGYAFGGYARKSLGVILNALEESNPGARVEDHTNELNACLKFAKQLLDVIHLPD